MMFTRDVRSCDIMILSWNLIFNNCICLCQSTSTLSHARYKNIQNRDQHWNNVINQFCSCIHYDAFLYNHRSYYICTESGILSTVEFRMLKAKETEIGCQNQHHVRVNPSCKDWRCQHLAGIFKMSVSQQEMNAPWKPFHSCRKMPT